MSTTQDVTTLSESLLASNAAKKSSGRRFRWRVIPVTLLYIYGGCEVFDGLIYLGAVYGFSVSTIWRDPTGRDIASIMLYIVLAAHGAIAVGWLTLFAGRELWRGRWRRGVIGTIVVAAIHGGVAAVVLFVGG
jgi:hypothetical protein